MNKSQSNAQQPDLDWSQVRETVKLIAVSVSQVEESVLKGDHSVNNLSESFTAMVKNLEDITAIVDEMEDGEAKEKLQLHCMMTSSKVTASIIEFQFYDRMKQCLEHVTENLMSLSHIVDNPKMLYSPRAWHELQIKIRASYSMETEKIMFDAILKGASIQEAIALANAYEHVEEDEDDIELF